MRWHGRQQAPSLTARHGRASMDLRSRGRGSGQAHDAPLDFMWRRKANLCCVDQWVLDQGKAKMCINKMEQVVYSPTQQRRLKLMPKLQTRKPSSKGASLSSTEGRAQVPSPGLQDTDTHLQGGPHSSPRALPQPAFPPDTHRREHGPRAEGGWVEEEPPGLGPPRTHGGKSDRDIRLCPALQMKRFIYTASLEAPPQRETGCTRGGWSQGREPGGRATASPEWAGPGRG